MMRSKDLTGWLVATGVCLLVGVAGGLATASSVRQWYPLIEKPDWTPPDAIFGPVWTALYLMMGTSAWLVWRGPGGVRQRRALSVFATQLLLNVLWSFLFFGLRSPGWAAVEIALLWIAIAATLILFARISRLAAGLLLPYLLWVSFAAALNLAIWQLNRV